jgi:hypothetical protein
MQLVIVFETGDRALLGIAKQILETEGIEYQVRREQLQHLFGLGTIGTGFNVVAGPAEVIVRSEDAPNARHVLRDLVPSA